MELEVKPEETTALAEARRRRAKRRREIIRRFAEQFENAPAEISPQWQRAIDNYKRIQGIQSAEPADAGE